MIEVKEHLKSNNKEQLLEVLKEIYSTVSTTIYNETDTEKVAYIKVLINKYLDIIPLDEIEYIALSFIL